MALKSFIFFLLVITSFAKALGGTVSKDLTLSSGVQLHLERSLIYQQIKHKLPLAIQKTVQEKQPLLRFSNLESNHWGRLSLNEIQINQSLKDKDQQRALIHELAHLYDRDYTPSTLNREWASWCSQQENPDQFCYLIQSQRSRISTEPRFLEVAGWPIKIHQKSRLEENIFSLRQFDSYGYQNSFELFATALEAFLLDEDFTCRQPTLNDYFHEHFQNSGGFETSALQQKKNSCHSDWITINAKPQLSVSIENQSIKLINAQRVYEIQYLMASPGGDVASKFGHSFIKLIVCSPNRQQVGPDCLNDTSDHLVVSFRAFVDSPQIDLLKGLNGSYFSKLFFIPWTQITHEYNWRELRHLEAFPLKLSLEQKNKLLNRIIEYYWMFSSKYYFVSQNCAVETFSLIKSALATGNDVESLHWLSEVAIFPSDVKSVLKKYSLISDDKRTLFSSHKTNLDIAWKQVTKVDPSVAQEKNNYSKKLLTQRTALIKDVLSLCQKKQDPDCAKKTAAAFLLIEREIHFRNLDALNLEPLKNDNSELDSLLNQLSLIEHQLTSPGLFLKVGYGIGQKKDFTISTKKEVKNLLGLKLGLKEKEQDFIETQGQFSKLESLKIEFQQISGFLMQWLRPKKAD